MATSSNVPVNGSAKVVEETKTTGSTTTASSLKSKQESIPKTNGHAHQNGKVGVNGNAADSPNGSPRQATSPPNALTDPSFEVQTSFESLSLEEQHPNHSQDDPDLKRDLYVGNLNPHVSTQMLKDLFGGDATVENVKIVPDRTNTHGGFGYGFVTMKTREDAEKYLSELQGFSYMGAELRVNWATPTKSAEQGLSVFIGDIGPDVSKEDLTEAFKDPEARITDTRIVMDPVSGRTKGYGFVSYTDPAAAARALSKNGEILKGRRIRVNWATTGKESKMMPGQPYMYPPEAVYGQPMAPVARPDVTNILLAQAQFERLDVAWFMSLSLDIQAGIVRMSQEAPTAKTMWVGNLDKNTTQIDLLSLFAQYGLIEEVTMVSPQGYAFISMSSHLMAATLIVLFKDFVVRGRKLKTGWSHSTQRQLQQAAAASIQQPHPGAMMPPHAHHRPQPNMAMQPPPPQMQMSPIPMAPQPGPFLYQPQMMYPYVQPVASYTPALVHQHPNGTPTGTSTPRSATSENAAPLALESQIKDTPSPR